MKLIFFFILILILLNNCSFDNKTGIWNSNEKLAKKKIGTFNEFKALSISKDNFNKTIKIKKNYNFSLPAKLKNKQWIDIFYNQSNNQNNLSYSEKKNIIKKSKKISKQKSHSLILFKNDNLITTDIKGNVIVFSAIENKIITKFNFYKKKFKKIEKNLNIIIEGNIIYISDNIGFIYAFDYENKKILWALNNKIPFRSNLKIKDNKLITADQNNNVYFFNKNNGNIIKLIPTEDSKIKNNFINNFSLSNNLIMFLNTYGSLYGIDKENLKIKWVININQSLDVNPNNLFNGNPVVNNNNFVVVTSHQSTYVIDSSTGSLINKYDIVSQLKPLIIDNHLFLVSTNNFLICINLLNGEIVYSYEINDQIAEYFNVKKKTVTFQSLMFANNKIIILLKNSYILEFEINGSLIDVFKLSAKINSNLIFIDNYILFLDRKNKLIVLG